MISKSTSEHILLIGTDLEGKGGIAVLLKMYSEIFTIFHFICSHKFCNKFNQLLLAIYAIIKMFYYFLFFKVRVVHIHTASYHSFFRDSVYILIAKICNKKVVIHIHGGKFEQFYYKYPHYCNYICRKADSIVCVSKCFADIFRRLQLNEKICVIYNASEKPLYQKIKSHEKVINILFLGAIDDNKGIFDVLECLFEYKSYFQNKILLNIGGVGDDIRLKEMIKKYELQDIVLYHGWINYEKKNQLFAVTDIYIQPSYFESLGIAIIEAMNYAIPVIASNTGGIPELISTGDNGILIEPGDRSQLFYALCRLIEDSDLREQMGKKTLEKSKKFTLEQMEENLIKLYTTLLG